MSDVQGILTLLMGVHVTTRVLLLVDLESSYLCYQQINSAKSVDKDVKVLKSKLSDQEVAIKSLEAELVALESRGIFSSIYT